MKFTEKKKIAPDIKCNKMVSNRFPKGKILDIVRIYMCIICTRNITRERLREL